jgi:L-aminopeptidase/D-esterase-like protein
MTVMLQPASPVDRIHALFLTGGGLFGLPAAAGVVRFCEERKIGFDWGTPDLRIPIVVSAVIDDLAVGDPPGAKLVVADGVDEVRPALPQSHVRDVGAGGP